MRKPNVELLADAHAVFRRAGQNDFMKREASSLCADLEGCNMCNLYNKWSDLFIYCSSNYEFNIENEYCGVDWGIGRVSSSLNFS